MTYKFGASFLSFFFFVFLCIASTIVNRNDIWKLVWTVPLININDRSLSFFPDIFMFPRGNSRVLYNVEAFDTIAKNFFISRFFLNPENYIRTAAGAVYFSDFIEKRLSSGFYFRYDFSRTPVVKNIIERTTRLESFRCVPYKQVQ